MESIEIDFLKNDSVDVNNTVDWLQKLSPHQQLSTTSPNRELTLKLPENGHNSEHADERNSLKPNFAAKWIRGGSSAHFAPKRFHSLPTKTERSRMRSGDMQRMRKADTGNNRIVNTVAVGVAGPHQNNDMPLETAMKWAAVLRGRKRSGALAHFDMMKALENSPGGSGDEGSKGLAEERVSAQEKYGNISPQTKPHKIPPPRPIPTQIVMQDPPKKIKLTDRLFTSEGSKALAKERINEQEKYVNISYQTMAQEIARRRPIPTQILMNVPPKGIKLIGRLFTSEGSKGLAEERVSKQEKYNNISSQIKALKIPPSRPLPTQNMIDDPPKRIKLMTSHLFTSEGSKGLAEERVSEQEKNVNISSYTKAYKISPPRPIPIEINDPPKKIKVTDPFTSEGGFLQKLGMWPIVTTASPDGRRIEGLLQKFERGDICIICVCHGWIISPVDFVKHASGKEVEHPLRHINVHCSSLNVNMDGGFQRPPF